MSTKIAMSTIRDLPVTESIDIAVKSGCNGIEIQTDYLPENQAEIEYVFSYAKENNLTVSLHAPCGDINISALNKGIRMESIRQVKEAIDLAAKYNARVVTFHPGRLSSARENIETKWQVLLESVSEIALYAKYKRVYVAIENMENRKKEIVFSIDDLNRFASIGNDNPYFGVTLDFSHFATNEIFCPELDKLALPVKNVHISQTVDLKPHFPLYEDNGSVKTDYIVEQLKNVAYDSFYVMEIKAQTDYKIFEKSRVFLQKLG